MYIESVVFSSTAEFIVLNSKSPVWRFLSVSMVKPDPYWIFKADTDNDI